MFYRFLIILDPRVTSQQVNQIFPWNRYGLDSSDQKAFQGDFKQFNAMNNRVPGTGDAVESKKDK